MKMCKCEDVEMSRCKRRACRSRRFPCLRSITIGQAHALCTLLSIPCTGAFDFYDLSKYMLINFFIPSVIVDASKNSVNDFVSHSI